MTVPLIGLPSPPPTSTMRMVFRAIVLSFLVVSASGAARGESAAEETTRSLLERLDERQMPDVMLWVIERAAADPAISGKLKGELPFLRATALVGTTRTESDATKRAALLDEAEKSIDTFLATSPTGDPAIAAYTQKGNLLIERGRGKLDLAKRPGQDAKKLSAEGVAFFESAIKSLKGTVKPDQKDIATVTNAEDAVLRALREVDAQIDTIKAGGKANGDGPAKLSPSQQKEVDRLEEKGEVALTLGFRIAIFVDGGLVLGEGDGWSHARDCNAPRCHQACGEENPPNPRGKHAGPPRPYPFPPTVARANQHDHLLKRCGSIQPFLDDSVPSPRRTPKGLCSLGFRRPLPLEVFWSTDCPGRSFPDPAWPHGHAPDYWSYPKVRRD